MCYTCEICDYKTKIKGQYANHTKSKKHLDMINIEEVKVMALEEQKETYEIKIETLTEEYENKLLDKNDIIRDLQSQIQELKADLLICEQDRDKFEERYKETHKDIDERVAFVTQDVKEKMNAMKDKMHSMELERQAETLTLNQRLKDYNRYTKEQDEEHKLIIERMEMKHENELLKAQLNNKQDIIDLSFNKIINQPVAQPVAQPAPLQIQQVPYYPPPPPYYPPPPSQPRTKPKPENPVDFVDVVIEVDQLRRDKNDWSAEYDETTVLETAYTDDEVCPKIYKEFLKGKNYEDCFMDILMKEIKPSSFYYKTEKDKQGGVYQIFYQDEWLSPDQSDKKLEEVISVAMSSISNYNIYKNGVFLDYEEKMKKPNPDYDNSSTEPMFVIPGVCIKAQEPSEKLRERIYEEYFGKTETTEKYIKNIKSRILKNVLI